jgi:tRNA(Ile)-lysidine synthase
MFFSDCNTDAHRNTCAGMQQLPMPIEHLPVDCQAEDINITMSLLYQFREFISNQHLFSPRDKLLLAVSGGVDSVVLCELCRQAGYDFMIAHCNFQLRGQESERDEQFVKGLGPKYNNQVLVKRFETEQYANTNKVSIQVAARELRYNWFAAILNGQYSMDTDPLPQHRNHADEFF